MSLFHGAACLLARAQVVHGEKKKPRWRKKTGFDLRVRCCFALVRDLWVLCTLGTSDKRVWVLLAFVVQRSPGKSLLVRGRKAGM